MNHRKPAQLIRLIGALRRELADAPIVIHNDKFRAEVDASSFYPFEDVHLLTSDKPIRWGDFSFVDAYWRCLDWIIEHVDFDWVVLLSAQDYPIKSLATLGDYFAATGADALFRATPISQLENRTARRDRHRRYLYQYRPVVERPHSHSLFWQCLRWLRPRIGVFVDVLNYAQPFAKIYRFPDQMPWPVGFRAHPTPFTKNKPCWYGSMWLTLSQRAARFVVAYAKERPGYVDYYRRTTHPDESATSTLICNAEDLHVEPRNVHYTRWSHSGSAHPDIFRLEDLPELLSASEYFARKFDSEEDAEILDRLDDVLSKSRPATSSDA